MKQDVASSQMKVIRMPWRAMSLAALLLAMTGVAGPRVLAGDAPGGDAPAAEDAPQPGENGTLPTPSDPRWRFLLRDQLKSEKNCDLHDVLTYNEMKLGEGVSISGRVSCIDGREYDFDRRQPHLKFEVRLCEPTVC